MLYFYKNHFTNQLALDANNLGLLRGYSAFEYIRTYQQTPFCLKAHLSRFLYSITALGLISPYTMEELESISLELIKRQNSDCGVKWYAFALNHKDGLRHDGSCELFAMTSPMQPIPEQYLKEGIKAATFFEKRPVPYAKTTAYLAAVQLLSEKKDLQEVLYLDSQSRFLEASTSNLFFVKNGRIYTAGDQILHGITREVVLDISRSHFETIEEKLPYEALSSVDEVFITATNKEVMPVAQIDQYSFKVGEITQFLMEEFQKICLQGSNKEYIPPLYEKCVLLKS